MGNRAIITTKKFYDADGTGVYLHWNGGYDSVRAFTEYCKRKGYRDPEADPSYALARLVQVVGNFFGGSDSVGIVNARCGAAEYDNGVYLIGKNWEIVGRREFEGIEQNEYDLEDAIKEIDKRQPERLEKEGES